MLQPKIKSPDLVRTRRAQISRAAVELFALKGYHGTTVRDIARQSGLSIGSLYDYINNKEDILYLLAEDFYDNLRGEVVKVLEGENDVITKLEGTLETMLRVVDRFQEYTLFTYRESKYLKKEDLIAVQEQEAFFIETFRGLIETGIKEGHFERQDPEMAAIMLTLLTHAWALKRYNLKKFSFYAFQKRLIQFVLHGLLKDTPPLAASNRAGEAIS